MMENLEVAIDRLRHETVDMNDKQEKIATFLTEVKKAAEHARIWERIREDAP